MFITCVPFLFEARWHASQHSTQPNAPPPPALDAHPVLTNEVCACVSVSEYTSRVLSAP